jgi:competence protein ComGC
LYKKRGTTLVEVVVSCAIIILLITLGTSITVKANEAFRARSEEEEINRLTYCIMQEIKYNYTMEEVEAKLRDNYLGLKNNKYFFAKLENTPLFNFEEGEDIKIYLINKDNDSITVKVTVNKIYSDGLIERQFEKYWWTDEL